MKEKVKNNLKMIDIDVMRNLVEIEDKGSFY